MEDKLDTQMRKELGGHKYNVARQQKSYDDSIRHIWEAQKRSLQSSIDQSDVEFEDESAEELVDAPVGGRNTTLRNSNPLYVPPSRR